MGGPFWFYQHLPRSLLAVRNPVVILDWSTNAYQPPDLALHQPCETFTNHYHRGGGEGGQGTDLGVDLISQVCHTVNGRRVATWAVW
jgi:hypothetical protein